VASNLAPGAAPGAAAGAAAGAARSGNTKDREENDTHFEISKTLRSVEQAPGTVKRMSIAVIVDHATQWDKDAKGQPVAKEVARSADELKKIREQVSAAVGFQARRGDDLTVENMPFAPLGNPKEEKEAQRQQYIAWGRQLAPGVGYLILGLIVFFLVVLPMLRRLGSALSRPAPLRVRVGEGGDGEHGSPRKFTPTKSVNEIQAEIEAELNAEGASGAPEAQRRGLIKKRIQESTAADAETVASLVRSWILEDGR
jgi:flagellar M-ring protein FliF